MKDEDRAWTDYRERFSEVYDEANYSSPLQKMVMNASHKLLEKAHNNHAHFNKVLEVGAGTGEHIKFLHHTFDHYILTDSDPKALEIAKKKIAGTLKNRVQYETQDAGCLSYLDNTFDRLISIHVLEHVAQPHLVIKEWCRVLKDGGTLSILIPTDPGLAWRFGRYLGPRKNAIKQGIAYDYIMAREHVNASNNLIAILRHYFPEAHENWWPFFVPFIDCNLFYAFHSTVIKN